MVQLRNGSRRTAAGATLLLVLLLGVPNVAAIFVPRIYTNGGAVANVTTVLLGGGSSVAARATIDFYPPNTSDTATGNESQNASGSPSICIVTSSLDDLPPDLFTEEQRLQGAIVLHFLAAIYFFMLLAYVCSEYFLPSVECLCEDLKLSQDVAAATFMATATSMPEFFTNTISTLAVDSDIGVGTIMGSMLFNTLGVAALVGLLTKMHVQLDWWPLTRDSIIVTISTTLLVVCVWDGRIEWYEAMLFSITYVLYFVVMFKNESLKRIAMHYIQNRWNLCGRLEPEPEDGTIDDKVPKKYNIAILGHAINGVLVGMDVESTKKLPPSSESSTSAPIEPVDPSRSNSSVESVKSVKWSELTQLPEASFAGWRTIMWIFTWPYRFVVFLTIPDPLRFRKLYPLTFVCCIGWIGVSAYLVFWMISVIGNTFGIPDTVMGMTFLAFGGCMPEAASAITLIRRGNGAMGVSNSLGANTLAILFSLGLPWFIRTMIDGGPSTGAYIAIQSYGIQYSVLALFGAIFTLYAVLYVAKYTLRKMVGLALAVGYLVIVTFMILVELDVFFPADNRC
ncbi:sodium/potassium/calcium exchanger 4-like [Anopheles arabiensis]|uniref:Sodium/calcium exchanger membrane region domain-containing protein n=1 Tax=Anopheles arabiensis TaxID=7173 RepID=A0A2C9GR82_ANOAR|nr:sodium/potassium/calcium exchanger 4-like [Anopheles arabiensis]